MTLSLKADDRWMWDTNVAGSLGTEISEPLNPLDGALDPKAQDSTPPPALNPLPHGCSKDKRGLSQQDGTCLTQLDPP